MTTDATTDGPNRATVALVDAKIDGLKELTKAEFAATREQLAPLAALPVEVTKLRADQDALRKRVKELEDEDEKGGDRRWAFVLAVAVAIFTAAANIVVAVIHLH